MIFVVVVEATAVEVCMKVVVVWTELIDVSVIVSDALSGIMVVSIVSVCTLTVVLDQYAIVFVACFRVVYDVYVLVLGIVLVPKQ